jgi:hypothetical protein
LIEDKRFWKKVNILGENDCWNWLGSKNKDGYGHVGRNKKNITASKYAWNITYGEIPDGMCVLHKCDNPTCVNPNHLYLGTRKQNSKDTKDRNRMGNSGNRLSLKEIDKIKLMKNQGITNKEIGDCFNIAISTIRDIMNEKYPKYRTPSPLE